MVYIVYIVSFILYSWYLIKVGKKHAEREARRAARKAERAARKAERAARKAERAARKKI